MRVLVLGSAAGGGYPQWNCRCPVCDLYWQGDSRVRRRTQSSIAVTQDGDDWVIINCSPDIREQIGAHRPLQPRRGPRHSPIAGVVLANADIDHLGGLLSLRESHPFTIWASEKVIAQIDSNPVFSVLDRSLVKMNPIEAGAAFSPVAELEITPFEVPGKAPLYREASDGTEIGRHGDTYGFHLDAAEARATYLPGCGAIDATLLNDLKTTQVLLFDGTLWTDDEMITLGVGKKSSRRMGHVPVSGNGGSLQQLADISASRRFFIHINNTNPLLVEGSQERSEASAQGWDVASDGMEITL